MSCIIRLDERNAQKFPWLSVVGGRFVNPYGTPTDLIFHKDLTFEGVALTGRLGLGRRQRGAVACCSSRSARIRCRRSHCRPRTNGCIGAQLGHNLRWGEGQRLRLAPAFYDYFNVDRAA